MPQTNCQEYSSCLAAVQSKYTVVEDQHMILMVEARFQPRGMCVIKRQNRATTYSKLEPRRQKQGDAHHSTISGLGFS